MSLAGRNRTRGQRYEVYRATTAVAPGGLATLTWSNVTFEGRGMVDAVGQDLVQRIFGREVTCDLRLFASPGADLRHDDGIVFRSPALDGRRFRVRGIAPFLYGSRNDHLELALEETTEDIP